MAWQDRLQEASYTSPSGVRQVFRYNTKLNKSIRHKLNKTELADENGTFVQDLGNSSPSFVLECIFVGEDYDLEANRFELLLLERGRGILQHPTYGNIDVFVDTIERVEDPINSAGRAIFKVTFLKGKNLPTAFQDLRGSLEEVNIEISESLGKDLASNLVITNAAAEQSSIATVRSKVSLAIDTFGDAVKSVEALNIKFNNIANDIINNISELLSTPAVLASQIKALLLIPSQTSDRISVILGLYNTYFESILNIEDDSSSQNARNEAIFAEVFAISTASAIATVTANAVFKDRNEAISIFEYLRRVLNISSAALDSYQERFEDLIFFRQYFSETSTYGSLINILEISAAEIIKQYQNLAIAVVITTNEPTHYLKVVARENGSLSDEVIDQFISVNRLSYDEMVLIPKGRRLSIFKNVIE